MNDPVAEFRKNRVLELQHLIDGCRDDELDIAVEAANLMARLRELYYFAPDMRSLAEHVRDVATRFSIHAWASTSVAMNDQPWSRIVDEIDGLLQCPPLYQRDWSVGAIDLQFPSAVDGYLDLAGCVQHVRENSQRADQLDVDKLIFGTAMTLNAGCSRYFEYLGTPGAENLRDILQIIANRPDRTLDMFPMALTYFGSDGVSVLNRVTTEVDDIRDALVGYADRGSFDR